MSRAAFTPLAMARCCVALAPPFPKASPVSLRNVASAEDSYPGDRPGIAPVALLSAMTVSNSRYLDAAPYLLSSLLRRLSGVQVRCNSGNGFRSSSSASLSRAPAPRERHVCPECRKRFLCEANLLRHRATRHGVQVASASDVARAQVEARNAQLQQELARVQARVRQLREGGDTAARQAHAGATLEHADDTARAAYPSAVLTGRLMEVDEAVEQAWRHSGRGLGTGISFGSCIGTVLGPVELGTLRGATPAPTADGPAAELLVLQFVLEAHGYRERRPGQLKMYRSHLLVRYVAWQPYHLYGDDDGAGSAPLLFKVQEGDLLRVQGHYALHSSYDMISKQSVENVVLEADAVGMLRPAHVQQTSTAQKGKEGSPTQQQQQQRLSALRLS
ncbi:hypothetical protein, conserved [Leishmania tarentolae]|uniref:C2H2-type domain-containing protein n=1 Tax=Leishmania tarentolae TaxID=5689 RepID=A0A640K8W1_LEITA|nr:hypothetical protein, conserved [Leishmania tarentolae]